MRVIADAVVEAGTLAYFVYSETQSLELRKAAERTIEKLRAATDRIIEMGEKANDNT